MDILPLTKGLLQTINARDMRQNAQFDLAVIQAHQNLALFGNKGFANASTILTAHRDILQIRVGRGQTTGIGPSD